MPGRPLSARRPVLLFDVLDTLVTEPYFTDLPAFFGMHVADLKRQMHPTSWIDFEEGRIMEAEYYARFFLDGRPVDAERLRSRVRSSYRWLEGMEPLVADLHAAGYQLHALSNYSLWYLLIEEALQVSRYVEWTFVSCRTGLRKPAPEAYWNVTHTLQVEPQECFFVDDRPENVAAAWAIGMDAVLKTDAASLRRELQQRGVLG